MKLSVLHTITIRGKKISFLTQFVLLTFLFSFLSSCTEPIDIKLDSSFSRLVVFGEISTDTTIHRISLTRSADYFYNKPAEGVSGALVKINDGTREITLTENPLNPGSYETLPDYYGVAGKIYNLFISNVDVNNDGVLEAYSASSFLPELAEIDSIKLNYAVYPFFTGYEIHLYALDPPETIDYYAFKVVKNSVQQTDSIPEIIIQNDILFNGNYTNGISVQYLDDRKPGEKGIPGDTVTFEMYGISAGYYKFLLEAQTELFGSNPLFSGPPANLSTNLTNGAVGYFATVNVKRAQDIIGSQK